MKSPPTDIGLRFEAWDKFHRTHVDVNADLTMVVLKVHLVIEALMISIIGHSCHHPEHLRDARLSFSQKFALMRALAAFPMEESICEGIKILNTIRNDLAHNLESTKIENHYNEALRIARTIEARRDWAGSTVSLATGKDGILFLAGYCGAYLTAAEVISHVSSSAKNT
jgi:hypothetical protein